MNKSQMMRKGEEPKNLVEVLFNNKPISIINIDDGRFVVMKSVASAIGIDWNAQYQRIKRDSVLSKVCVNQQYLTEGGLQEVTTIPLEYLPGWLFGISTNAVKPELRETIDRYKLECYAVLANHFKPKQRLELDKFKLPEEESMRKELSYQTRDYHAKHVIKALTELMKLFHSNYVTMEALATRISENRVFLSNQGLFRELLFNSTIDALIAENIIEVNANLITFCEAD
jgi:hypothetical protein